MSNFQDCVMYLASLGDSCPTSATLKVALSSGGNYAKNGDSPYPGVTFVDVDNGLVHIAAVDSKAPNTRFCAFPAMALLDPAGQGHATVEWNTAAAQRSDEHIWMWTRVMGMVKQNSDLRPWVPGSQWVDSAESVGAEFVDWPSVIDHVVNHWQPSK